MYLTFLNLEARIGDHKKQIETDRYQKTSHYHILYLHCKEVEDEKHFLLSCTNNGTLRNVTGKSICKENPAFKYYSNLENNSEFLKLNILI